MNLVPTGFGTKLSFLFLDIEDFAVDIIGKVAENFVITLSMHGYLKQNKELIAA